MRERQGLNWKTPEQVMTEEFHAFSRTVVFDS